MHHVAYRGYRKGTIEGKERRQRRKGREAGRVMVKEGGRKRGRGREEICWEDGRKGREIYRGKTEGKEHV